jgi:N-acetylmuramoyl-L-alanine amidase
MDLSNAQLREQVFARSSRSRSKRLPKLSVLASYAAVFALIVSIVAIGYRPPQATQLANAAAPGSTDATGLINIDKPSVDELVATDIAANLAESTNMPVASQVAELSSSLAAKVDLSQTSYATIDKPQITELAGGSKLLAVYQTKPGDTVTSIAAAHGLSTDTIKWANNLVVDAIEPGKDILIPPVDGVVYTIKNGDTPDSLAATYKADKNRIEAFNNFATDGFTAGEKVIIPGGILPADQVPGYRAPSAATGTYAAGAYGGGSGYRISSDIARASAGNRYAFGNCTWYAYERRQQLGRPVGSFWGNAKTWSSYARAAGYLVDNSPEAGAVLVDQTGWAGHVGVVESVMANGDIVISEMNNAAYGGFNVVDRRTISAGQAALYQYIH